MATMKRHKTKYPGVYFIEGKIASGNKTEKIYYIRYRRDGKSIEEKAGRQYQNDMTPSRASGIRAKRIEGKQKSNTQRRKRTRSKITIQKLADEYFSLKTDSKSNRFLSIHHRPYLN